MTPFAQNLAVILIISVCVAYVGWQIVQAFRGRKSKLGSCCAKGCSSAAPEAKTPSKPAPAHFLPLGNVGVRPRR